MKKKTLYTEISYVLGIVCLAIGATLMTRADFGVSMVVAPAYLLHLKISEFLPFFSFGMAEYTLQAVVLVLMGIVLRRFKLSYLFSFITAVFYGFTLDFNLWLLGKLPMEGMSGRMLFFILGMLFSAAGVSFVFHTYISPEAYELFVKEIARKYGKDINKVKTIYDCTSCLVAICMSFSFYGMWHFEGVKLGTIFCALINGTLIGLFSKLYERCFEFKDGLKLRSFFENADKE